MMHSGPTGVALHSLRCKWREVLAIPVMLGAALLSTLGCGPKAPPLVAVTGKVTMAGQPLTAGSIILHPSDANSFQDDNPSSLLQLDGGFTVRTFPFGDGVPPGKYKVTLAPELASRIRRPEYADPKRTPWELEVPATGSVSQNFEVQ